MYVEEELEILARGADGKYGLLRRLDSGKYAVNFVLLSKEQINEAQGVYIDRIPKIGEVIVDFIEKKKDDYLAFPYLNKKKDLNLIIWQQIMDIAWAFEDNVKRILREKYFGEEEIPKRPFTVYGHECNGKAYGCGNDGIGARNLCGYSWINFQNIYISRIKKHFSCGHDISNDVQLQLALRAIEGLEISSLSEEEKEQAAKAVECGYLYREGETLYTKILMLDRKDCEHLFDISNELVNGYFEKDAEEAADKIAKLTKKAIPDYLMGEWEKVNRLAGLPLLDSIVEVLIEKGVITPPENGIGAEGCWGIVSKESQ